MSATVQFTRYWPGEAKGAATHRAASVDALRGLMILGMVLYFAQPYEVLPAWMYHAQEPPPTHAPDFSIAGLTWPDIVFPIFVFTLGASIPLALGPRLDRGENAFRALGGAILRGALLMFFAVFRQHYDSATTLSEPPAFALMSSVAGFAALLAVFARLPSGWSRRRRTAVRAAGWATAGLMFLFVPAVDGSMATPWRIDGVIAVLAYCAVAGTAVWLVTRRSLPARLAVLGGVVLFKLLEGESAWIAAVYDVNVPSWLYDPARLHYLCLVIPGTIVGDLIYQAVRGGAQPPGALDVRPGRRALLVLLLLAIVPVLIVGITARDVVATGVAAAVACGAAIALALKEAPASRRALVPIVTWGAAWVLGGIAIDPFDGGTRKLPPSFSWFFICSGLGALLVAALHALGRARLERGPLRLLSDVGQNPLLAYVAYGMVMLPALGLSGIKLAVEASEPGPWGLFAWGVAVTLTVALLVQQATRRRLFWRA